MKTPEHDGEPGAAGAPPVVGPVVGVMIGFITVKLLAGSVPLWGLALAVVGVVALTTWISLVRPFRRR